METFIGIVLCGIGFLFCYMSSHIIEEERQGRRMPMFWEKKDGE